LYKAKRFDEFEKIAETVLDEEPGNTELRMMLYTSHRERGDFSRALEEILELKKLGARGADLMPHLDFLAQSMGQRKEAIPAWQAILDIDRSNRSACVSLAYIHAAIGEQQLADQYLQRAVELAPEQAPALYYEMASRLLTAKNAGPAETDRGIRLLNEAIELSPGFAPCYKRLGLALWKKEDYAGTRAAFEKYLELNPDGDDKEQIEEYLADLSSVE
jgi:tetratricopeptide (TPR) repeat protein